MSFNDKTLLFLMWLPIWQDGFQNHNNNNNILHLQMYMYLFFCGHWGRSSHCSRFIWRSLLSCKHGKWVKAIKSISFSLNQTQWICSKWCFGCAGRCSIQLLKRAFNTLQKKKRNIWINFVVAHIQSLRKSLFVVLIFKALKKEITWKNNSKYDQSTLPNKFLNLASPGGKSQTVQSNIIWLLNEGWKIILQSWEMKVV